MFARGFNAQYNSRQAIYVQLRIAQRHVEFEFNAYIRVFYSSSRAKAYHLRIEYLKFDQPSVSEMTFKDVSGKLPKSCPSYKCVVVLGW